MAWRSDGHDGEQIFGFSAMWQLRVPWLRCSCQPAKTSLARKAEAVQRQSSN